MHRLHVSVKSCLVGFSCVFVCSFLMCTLKKGIWWVLLLGKVEGMEVGLTLGLENQEGTLKLSLLERGCYVKDISVILDGGASWLYQGYVIFTRALILLSGTGISLLSQLFKIFCFRVGDFSHCMLETGSYLFHFFFQSYSFCVCIHVFSFFLFLFNYSSTPSLYKEKYQLMPLFSRFFLVKITDYPAYYRNLDQPFFFSSFGSIAAFFLYV